jgi:hypothetical protein
LQQLNHKLASKGITSLRGALLAFFLKKEEKMKVLQTLLGILLGLALVMPAHANFFEDVQDFDTTFGPLTLNGVYVRGDFDYTHELSGVSEGYRLDNAFLELAITGDFTDFRGNFLWFDWNFSEMVDASFPKTTSSGSIPAVSFGEVDNGTYSLPLQTDWLDGLDSLAVHLDVYNASGVADIFLLSSRLYGDLVEIAPNPSSANSQVPIPSAIYLLSSGLFLLVTSRKKIG